MTSPRDTASVGTEEGRRKEGVSPDDVKWYCLLDSTISSKAAGGLPEG